MPPPAPQDRIQTCIRLLKRDHTTRNAAAKAAIGKTKTAELLHSLALPEKRGSGPRRLISSPVKNRFKRKIGKNEVYNLPRARFLLTDLLGQAVSITTTCSTAAWAGLWSVEWQNAPDILARNRKKRLAFAQEHLHWTKDQWVRVLW